MESWVTSLISIVGSAIVTTVVSLVLTRVINKQFKQKHEAQEALEQRRTSERRTEIDTLIKDELNPIQENIKTLQEGIDKIGEGTLSSLRNDILTCYYRCSEKGYRNDYDTTNLLDLNTAYKGLHGNSFISDVVTRFMSLPTKEDFKEKDNKLTKIKKTKTEDNE